MKTMVCFTSRSFSPAMDPDLSSTATSRNGARRPSSASLGAWQETTAFKAVSSRGATSRSSATCGRFGTVSWCHGLDLQVLGGRRAVHHAPGVRGGDDLEVGARHGD